MASGEVMRILPPPSYRHRQPPPPSHGEDQALDRQQQQQKQLPQPQQQTDTQTSPPPQQLPQDGGATGTDPLPKDPSPMATSGGGVIGAELSPRQSNDLSFMHRPPAILPNYGKRSRGSVLPKSNVTRVLLYDNITQQSMLDVRINSIRSQSYKTNRELDMHMKSFLTRRKVREKALKKITRVPHLDDYFEFMQEQESIQQYPSAFSSRFQLNEGEKNLRFLPKLTSKKNATKSRPSAKSLVPNTKLFPYTIHQAKSHSTPSTERVPILNGPAQSKDETISLPQIMLTPPMRDQGGNEHETGKVGLRFVKGDQGLTRVFNVVSEDGGVSVHPKDTQNNDNFPKEYSNMGEKRTKADENNNFVNTSPSTPSIREEPAETAAAVERPFFKPRASIFQQKKRRDEEMQQQLKEQEELERQKRANSMDIQTELHPEKPMIDSRFLHLRRLLVPQDPPNEGFIELSPSFPKRYPSLKDLSPRSKRKAKEREKQQVQVYGQPEVSDSGSEYENDFSEDEF